MYHYAVNNSAPRPESYHTGKCVSNISLNIYLIFTTDYTTAANVSESQKAALYAELASGAETGWDYTMRWFRAGGLSSGLLSLNVRNTVAVDLNSLLCTL